MLKKSCISLFFMLFLSFPLIADDNTFTFSLDDYKVSSLIITKMEHQKNLFRYEDEIKLKEYLNKKDSNLSAINVFLVDTGKSKILFDAGTDSTVLIERLSQINIKPEDINAVCITHMHFDHIGGLIKNSEKTFNNATIYVSQEELEANPNSSIANIYNDSIKTFKQNEIILNNIQTIPAFGHTKGHTAFLILGKDKNLLIWGDMLHAVVQFQDSNIYMTYDNDPTKVLSLRKKFLDKYSNSNYYVAGSHLVYPGIGQIKKELNSYKFIPLEK